MADNFVENLCSLIHRLILGSMGILVPKVSALMTKAQYLLTQWCAHDMNWSHAALRVHRISGPEVGSHYHVFLHLSRVPLQTLCHITILGGAM